MAEAATNPIVAALAPTINAALAEIRDGLTSLVANPTIENVTAQGEKLALDALNPTALEGVSVQGVAQEALNLINALQAHLQAAAAAPSAATAPAAA